ncbi:hypothetical protein SEEM031_11820, partial [Salmonella enterica subsp. enterica serovar Montevideo str. SARB31]
AGNTLRWLPTANYSAVYPRWRGEHDDLEALPRRWHGLSPLARGTRYGGMERLPHRRFIPAGAGNTWGYPPVELLGSVYPRWRGEHDISRETLNCGHGLSPLARGTHYQRQMTRNLNRFIPAGAGNTRQSTRI